MGIEYWFLGICGTILLVFALTLAFSTAIMGKSYCKSFQFLWSSIASSKEAEAKISFLLNKLDANLIRAEFDEGSHTIRFFGITDSSRSQAEAEIWIGNKYFSYGYLYAYAGSRSGSFIKKRPSLKTFKRIVALEAKLIGDRTENAPPSKSSNKDKVVILE